MVVLTMLLRKDFDRILSFYDIGKYVSSRHIDYALENTNYVIKTTKSRFVVKIFEKISKSRLIFQLRVEEYAQKNGIRAPKVIFTRQGRDSMTFKGKQLIIYEFVEGRHIRRLKTKLILDLADNVGKMHKALLRCRIKPDNWTMADRIIRAYKAIPRHKWVRDELNNLEKDLRTLNYKKIRKSITHGDLATLNFLCKGDKIVSFLDWADTHKDFLVYDISILIAHTFMKKEGFDKKGASLFLRQYQKRISLDDEEKIAMYHFIKVRCMTGILWCEIHRKNHPDKRAWLDETISSIILQYKRLEKDGVGQFLRLF